MFSRLASNRRFNPRYEKTRLFIVSAMELFDLHFRSSPDVPESCLDMKTTLVTLIFLAAASPTLADELQISCETIRAYVAQVGLMQAKAQARAAGMTVQQERRARQCFVGKALATTR
jgi:hypothetical protein